MFASLLAATAIAAGIAAPTPIATAPTAPWQVDFSEAQCIASRSYGAATLGFKASPMGDVVQLLLLTSGGYLPAQQFDAVLAPSGGPAMEVTALGWNPTPGQSRRLTTINLTAAQFERLAASPAVQLQVGSRKHHLALGGMARLQQVMKTCLDDLQRVWSPSADGTPARSTAPLASFVTWEDYPREAIQKGLRGQTGFAMLIDEQGRVADCMVTETSGQAILDTQSCALLKRRARFVPARDLKGKPTRDRVTARINWVVAD